MNVVAVFLLVASIAAPAFAQNSGADIYKSKCAMCHGAAGLGDTPAGKAMKAASFKDPSIVNAPDAQLIAAVKNGKGKMPASIGAKMTDAEIKAVIAHVRALEK
jgi:cytochrome c6